MLRVKDAGRAAFARYHALHGLRGVSSSSSSSSSSRQQDATESYEQMYKRAQQDPDAFWAEAAGQLHWTRPWSRVRSKDDVPRWFPDGGLNLCYNALDRHVDAGRGDQPALHYHSAVTTPDASSTLTYAQLLDQVQTAAGAMQQLGVGKGDRVVLYMPMIPEAMVAMLACARIGAVAAFVFGGFASAELATRIRSADPALIVTASCGIEPGRVIPYMPMVAEALAQADACATPVLLVQRPDQQADLAATAAAGIQHVHRWAEAMAAAPRSVAVADTLATDPLYILYTSGTTGAPKGVVRDHGSAVALRWSMQYVYGMSPGSVVLAASDLGWVVGHSYIAYAPLLHACTSVLFEGKPVGTPDAGEYWRMVDRYNINMLFTSPTAFRALRRDDPDGAFIQAASLASLQALWLAGERSDPTTMEWAQQQLQRPVIDHWWQTETGWPICATMQGVSDALPAPNGSCGHPVPGYDVRILDPDTGTEAAPGVEGVVVLRLPLPPGTLTTLWNAEQRFRQAYLERFPGFYDTGDAGFIDENHHVHIISRTDDVINVAGHRIGTGHLEEVLAAHAAVAEAVVVGVRDDLKGQVPLGVVVLSKAAAEQHGSGAHQPELEAQLVALMRQRVGAVAALRHVVVVPRLPKTRSGKVLRRSILAIADGAKTVAVPATIDDPAILDEIRSCIEQHPAL